jgi:hypothetical protein
VADIAFNGASVGIAGAMREYVGEVGAPRGPRLSYKVTVVIRVHTAVGGQYNDEPTARKLIQSINNAMAENNALGSGMVVTGEAAINFGEEFEDSDTVGASFTFVVQVTHAHTQV